MYLILYNLLILQGLWQAHYLVFSTNFLKEFIKCKYGHDDKKNTKLVELHTKDATVFLNMQALKTI